MNKSSPELALLIAACLDVTADRPYDKLNLQKLDRLLRYHRIRPQLLSFLHKSQLDIGIRESLSVECQKITILNLMLAREVLRISDHLEANHIPCYAYKGILWAEWLYQNVGHREAGDIDLLVAPEHFDKALSLLWLEGGYMPDSYRQFLLKDPEIRQSFFKTDYHVLLGRELDSIVVELHWQVAYPRLGFDFPFGEWPRYAKRYPVAKGVLNGFDDEYQFLLLLVHHGGKEKWSSLKYIADFAAFMNRHGHLVDWGKVFRLANEKGIQRLLTWSLGVLKGLGTTWKQEWPDHIEAEDVSALISDWETMPVQPANSTLPYFKQSLAVHDGFAGKGKVVIDHMKYLSHWKLILHKARWYRQNP